MCSRYTSLTEDEIIEVRGILHKLPLSLVKDEFEQYTEKTGEVRPTDKASVITKNKDDIYFENLKWGFRQWNGKGVIINARSETIEVKSTFSKVSIGRCIIPASEFFEWKQTDRGKKKYYIKDKGGNLLFMAGLYQDTDVGREFVIITKQATGDMSEVHGRMPVLLREDQIESWLIGTLKSDDIQKMDYEVSVNPCTYDSIQISFF